MTVKNCFVPAGRSAAIAALAALAFGFAAPAFAQQPAQGAQKSMPPSATVYEDEASQRSFTFQQQGNRAIAKFSDSPEVMVLQAVPAQRGDTYWKDAEGKTIFKESELGGLTSFVDSENGSPAAFVAYGAPVATSAASLELKSKEVAAKLSKLAGHDVTVFGALAFNRNEAWAIEALDNVILGAVQANGLAGRVIAKLNAVRFELAKSANVTFKDGELVLGVNPAGGLQGRPSADDIARALTLARSSG
jgi:hypothetical protein